MMLLVMVVASTAFGLNVKQTMTPFELLLSAKGMFAW